VTTRTSSPVNALTEDKTCFITPPSDYAAIRSIKLWSCKGERLVFGWAGQDGKPTPMLPVLVLADVGANVLLNVLPCGPSTSPKRLRISCLASLLGLARLCPATEAGTMGICVPPCPLRGCPTPLPFPCPPPPPCPRITPVMLHPSSLLLDLRLRVLEQLRRMLDHGCQQQVPAGLPFRLHVSCFGLSLRDQAAI